MGNGKLSQEKKKEKKKDNNSTFSVIAMKFVIKTSCQ